MKFIRSIPRYVILFALVAFMFFGLASSTGRGMLVVIFCAIIVCMTQCLKLLNRTEICAIFILLLVNTAYFLVGNISRHSGFYANILLNLGIFYVSYFFSYKNKFSERELVVTYIFLLLATAYRFYVEREEMLYERNGNSGTMNLAYAFVIYMPFVFYIRNKILSVLIIIFTLFLVVNGAKRGAIFIFVVSAVYYIYFVYVKDSKRHKILHVIVAIGVLALGFYLMKDIYLENEYLQKRMEITMEGNSNGRDEIYASIWNKWRHEMSFLHFFFGYGFCSSLDIAGNRAHNDWLEILATAGLLGELVYISYWVLLLISKKWVASDLDKRSVNLVLLILFLKSLFSMSYCSVENMAIFLLLGFQIGRGRASVLQGGYSTMHYSKESSQGKISARKIASRSKNI